MRDKSLARSSFSHKVSAHLLTCSFSHESRPTRTLGPCLGLPASARSLPAYRAGHLAGADPPAGHGPAGQRAALRPGQQWSIAQAVHQALLDGHGFRHGPACACRANLAAAAASEPQLRASAPGLGSGPRLRASAPWLSLGTLAAFAFAAAGADRQCGIVTRQAAGRRRRAPGIPTSPGAPWRLESGPD